MNGISSCNNAGNGWPGKRKPDQIRMLRQQRQILQTGMTATAEVLDSSIERGTVGNLLPVWLWLRLKKADGSYTYIKSHTLVSLRQLPAKGQQLRIKYSPEHPGNVVIM